MKRLISLILAFAIMLSFCACQGNFGSVNLNEAIEIPENGMIRESVIKEIQHKNAIGVFTGESNGLRYEWTIFGSDITEAAEVNLKVEITKTADGNIRSLFTHSQPFGFTALLSIYLDEEWNAQSATAFSNGTAVTSVSITGSKATILNLVTDGSLGEVVIRPDELPEDAYDPDSEGSTEETKEPAAQPTTGNDNYLSKPEDGDDQVYTNGKDPYNTNGETTESAAQPAVGNDDYLSKPENSDGQVYSDGKDKYNTDPVPAGKPQPVEPEDQEVDQGTAYTCTFSIECSTILNNLDMLDPAKLEMVPSGGVILSKTTVTFYEGESVFDVLQRVCKENGIHMEAEWTPIYNSAYVEGIHNLYEFDCGALSGWMYKVNGWYPNYGSSRYQLKDGDVVEWRYTCDLGNDIGGGYAVGG